MASIVSRIAVRYVRSKKRSGFVSFISLASMIGIALGVMVLITVLSVMNGFDAKIKEKFFSLAPAVTVSFAPDDINNWKKYNNIINKAGDVTAIAPFVASNVMLSSDGNFSGAHVNGIDTTAEATFSSLAKTIIAGSINSLNNTRFSLVVGKTLADNLGLQVGDTLNVYIPQATTTPMGIFPRYKRCRIGAIFHADTGFGFDESVIYMNMNDAKLLFAGTQANYGLHIKLADVYQAQQISNKLMQTLPQGTAVSNWTQVSGAFFKALAMEKTMLFIILLLIILVAVFNLVSSLMMMVNDKQADIAILRTIGATPGMIMRIFMLQGFLVGVIGTISGIILGIVLSLNVTSIANMIQKLFHVQLVSSDVYFVNYLPSKLQLSDIWHVSLLALVFSFLATIYPSWSAFRTQPAEALRYE
jgi:lipoprotein-releasing system permease protein